MPKILLAERGKSGSCSACPIAKLALKLTCPADTSTCPTTLLNKGEIGLCPKHHLPSGASQGLVQLAPLPGPVVMLHAGEVLVLCIRVNPDKFLQWDSSVYCTGPSMRLVQKTNPIEKSV